MQGTKQFEKKLRLRFYAEVILFDTVNRYLYWYTGYVIVIVAYFLNSNRPTVNVGDQISVAVELLLSNS